MSYYQSLAFHLRLRSLPEDRVAEILAGNPHEYSRKFPKGEHRSSGGRVLLVAAALSALALAANVNADWFADVSIAPAGLPLALWIAAFLGAATDVGILLDRRMPDGFRPPAVADKTGPAAGCDAEVAQEVPLPQRSLTKQSDSPNTPTCPTSRGVRAWSGRSNRRPSRPADGRRPRHSAPCP